MILYRQDSFNNTLFDINTIPYFKRIEGRIVLITLSLILTERFFISYFYKNIVLITLSLILTTIEKIKGAFKFNVLITLSLILTL